LVWVCLQVNIVLDCDRGDIRRSNVLNSLELYFEIVVSSNIWENYPGSPPPHKERIFHFDASVFVKIAGKGDVAL